MPEPYHLEYWSIIDQIINLCNKYKKIYIQTPFPLISNYKIFWASIKILEKKVKQNCFASLVNINKNFYNRPKKTDKMSLKHISKNKEYMVRFAKKIVIEYNSNNQKNKSFSLTKKRFIAPHQYLMAKYFLKKNEKK